MKRHEGREYTILQGDVRETLASLPEQSVHCCVTSPPYWQLRSYLPSDHPDKPRELGQEKLHDCQGWATGKPCGGCFVCHMVLVFREVRRVLRDDGTCWVNMGDSYNNFRSSGYPGQSVHKGEQRGKDPDRKRGVSTLKEKDLCGIPWRLALALQADGWYLRDGIVWAKPNGMPGSQQDRCTSSYEMVFHLSKSARYWSDFDAIKTPPRESSLIRTAQDLQAQAGSHRANGGRKTNGTMKAVGVRSSDKQRGHSRRHAGFNDRWDQMEKSEQQAMPATMRNVWFVPPAQYKDAHFAVMPPEVARRCILAGCPVDGTVLDPFGGAGTTGVVALEHGRRAVLCELNPEYVAEHIVPRLDAVEARYGLFAG